jgi:acyl-CoA oxidase
VVSIKDMNYYRERLNALFDKIRSNALVLVDAFDWLDSNLNSTIGSFDGNVYERIYKFAQLSKFNNKDVHDVYYKSFEPFKRRYKHLSRL